MYNQDNARKVDELGRVLIPHELRLQLGIAVGDTLEVSAIADEVVVTDHGGFKFIAPYGGILFKLVKKAG
ncbi:MAG: AbrB/MazE/SpoVT family DNA-binding domain-containing protein [Defluviitaleaceae bacterium]|nr:AbrB/MazE/SpoVT family DNA-binding domain-containing protein [Defluviitaleaceae bacterium]